MTPFNEQNAWQDIVNNHLNSVNDIQDMIGLGSARRQREFEAAEAQKARDWSEMMSNTAHQREMADLKAAGLNPILSATGGQGAYTPGASSAHGVAGGQSSLANTINASANLIGAISKDKNATGNDISSAIKLVSTIMKFS